MDIAIETDGRVRYSVPERITRIKDTTLYFRVSDVYRNVKVTLYDGDERIIARSKIKVAPGEMETLALSAEMIKNNRSGKFKLGLEL